MKKDHVAQAFFKLLPKIYKLSPISFILLQLLSIFHGISFGVNTMATQYFIKPATDFTKGKATLFAVITSLMFLGLSHVVCQVLNGVTNFLTEVYVNKSMGKLSVQIQEKMSKLSPICFENTDILDDINKAENGKNNAVEFVWLILSIFCFYIPYFAFMSVYLFLIKPQLAILVIFVFAPTLFTQILRSKFFSKVEDKAAPIRREYEYYESCMAGREYFKETRILGAFTFFKSLYQDALVLMNKITLKASVKANFAELGMKLLSLCGYFGILYLLFIFLMNGEIGVDVFTAVFASIGLVFNMMEELIYRRIGNIAQNFGTIQNYLKFLDLPERGGDKISISKNVDIAVKNASFKYPNSEEKAVNNVNFTIKKGETLAIVGENGSGKSTLVRLITGLYSPCDGDVYYGGINTKDVDMKSLFLGISCVFQKYQRYQMTLGENIIISEVDKNFSGKELDYVCEAAGVLKASFVDGYDTMLSREFDGIDLSGGQWQRVAIARSFYRSHNLIILDEPTAAIDPIEETRIYNQFAKFVEDKTAIIVTHRLGSVKLADRILVMSKGSLIEFGTHDELIALGGEYFRLYKSQEQWYK